MNETPNQRTGPEPIVVEETYSVPPSAVWKAITDGREMRQWFFDVIEDFRPEVGFETRFNVRFEGRDYMHEWKVTEVVPERRIAYSFRYAGIPGDSVVTWELAEIPSGTLLRLVHQGQHTFPKDDPAFSREACQSGWEHFLRTSLKAFLERRS